MTAWLVIAVVVGVKVFACLAVSMLASVAGTLAKRDLVLDTADPCMARYASTREGVR